MSTLTPSTDVEQQLAALRSSIAVLLAANMPANVIDPLQQQITQIEQQIQRDGAAIVGGNVQTRGDFVSRDQIIHGDQVQGD